MTSRDIGRRPNNLSIVGIGCVVTMSPSIEASSSIDENAALLIPGEHEEHLFVTTSARYDVTEVVLTT
jgi:hypothetical protein